MDRRTFISYNAAAATVAVAGNALVTFSNSAIAATGSAPIDFKSNVPARGDFPKRWICGSSSCMDNTDPPVQVHWYNAHTAILRQNKAYSYEAPFTPLYFGNDRVLLLDEGFTQLRNDWDLRGVVVTLPVWNCWLPSAIFTPIIMLRSISSPTDPTRATWA